MKWFKRKIAQWAEEGQQSKYSNCSVDAPVREGDDSGVFSQRPLNIQILHATGGKIIRFSWYDDHVHQTKENLYLVAENEDFDKALTQFITLEAMKHGK